MSKAIHKTPSKKVFIVEDHPVFREGLANLLKRERDLVVCGQAADFDDALSGISRLQPDLVLVDISLPGKSGLDLIKDLRAGKKPVKILVISMHDEAVYANRVLRLGGDGYIMKQEDPSEIVHAIRDVLGGHLYLSEAVLARQATTKPARLRVRASSTLDELTDRQLRVLEKLGQGRSHKEIAGELGVTTKEVRAESIAIRRALKIGSENALIRFAVCWVESGTLG